MVAVHYFPRISETRCLISTVGPIATSVVQSDLQCAIYCIAFTNCTLFQLALTTNLCMLYAAMAQWYFNVSINVTSGPCSTFSSGWASVGNASRVYNQISDNRCLSSRVDYLASSPMQSDFECLTNCDANANCAMYQFMATTKQCTLYAAMTQWFFNTNINVTSSSCRTLSSGWGNCPASPYVYGNKSYYLNTTQMSMAQTANLCISKRQGIWKIDSYGELTYLRSVMTLSKNYWLGLTGNFTTGNLTWVVDGTPFNKTTIPTLTWSIDNCCTQPTLCYLVYATSSNVIIGDEGCSMLFYSLCYCQP